MPTGSLAIAICGGESPFDYLLENESTHQQFVYQGDRDYIFEELAAGNYTLTVSDILQQGDYTLCCSNYSKFCEFKTAIDNSLNKIITGQAQKEVDTLLALNFQLFK